MIAIEQIKRLVVLMRTVQLQTLATCKNGSSILLVLADTGKNADRDELKQADLTFVEQAGFLPALIMLVHTYGIRNTKINDASQKHHLTLADQPVQAEPTTPTVSIATSVAVPTSLKKLAICAPVTGVFYRAKSPNAEPCAAISEVVTINNIVGIIASMNMSITNPLLTEHTGSAPLFMLIMARQLPQKLLFTLSP